MKRVWLARLALGIIPSYTRVVGIIYICVCVCDSPGQSWAVLGRNHSVAYFDHITALQVLKCRTSIKGGAGMWCANVVSIHEFAQYI